MDLEIIKLNSKSKIILFLILLLVYIKNYFNLGFYSSSILFIQIGYPIIAILFVYFGACSLGYVIDFLVNKNK